MCGILTVVSKKEKALDAKVCRRALSSLANRGPDYRSDTLINPCVYFGQTILSLTGKVGEDPGRHLRSRSGRYRISFNGELYNYRDLNAKGPKLEGDFTDSEVLVNLFEQHTPRELQSKLDGMYAYAVMDEKEKVLRFVRDPLGEKSLYVFENDQMVVVSSEIPPIRALIGSLSLQQDVFKDYFHTRHFMFESQTPYENIRQIRPGEVWSYNLEQNRFVGRDRWSALDLIQESEYENYSRRSEEDLTRELDRLFSQCAREMIPQGRSFATVVSGGIDSSLISAHLLEYGQPQVLVAVNHVGKDQISDDLTLFEKALGKKIDRLDVDKLKYAWEISRCQRVLGSPLLSHSFIGQSVQSEFVRRQGCKALFGGEGGDELFGGYGTYLSLQAAGVDENSRFSPSHYTEWKASALFPRYESALTEELHQVWKECLARYAFIRDSQERTLQAMMAADFVFQLPAVGLRGADLMSMMWSLETRSVLVRKPLARFGLNLPLKMKLRASAPTREQTKWLLKQAFKLKYPAELIVQKQGFSGFPNEAGEFLGSKEDYLSLDFLNLKASQVADLDRATEWKLMNMEYFLRTQNL
ncbi:MAG: asparagine synthetase B [Bdellovibrionales bacterium]